MTKTPTVVKLKRKPKPAPKPKTRRYLTHASNRAVITPKGRFESLTLAADAYKTSRQLVHHRITRGIPGWEYAIGTLPVMDQIQTALAARAAKVRARLGDIRSTKLEGEIIGKELRAWRKHYRLSRADAADILEVSVRSLGEWEMGRACTQARLLLEIIGQRQAAA